MKVVLNILSVWSHCTVCVHMRGGLHKLRSMIAPTCLNWVACSQSRFMVKVSENSWSSSTKCVCVSLQSVPECDDKKRVSEEDDRGRKEEETGEEEDERNGDEGFMGMTPLLQAHHAMERMEEFVHKVEKNKTKKNNPTPPHSQTHFRPSS